MTRMIANIAWTPCWRIIPSRFPPVQLFERVTDPDDLGAVFELDNQTNARLRDESGDNQLIPPNERVSGPGASVIMAAFTHRNPEGSRFSNGSCGVFYAAREIETAIAETRYHRERFFRATAQQRTELDMRVYAVDLTGELDDLRGKKSRQPKTYHNDNYSASQDHAERLREQDSSGIVYDSLRHAGGECAAVFRPYILSNARQERHLCYVWNGESIESIYEKRALRNGRVPGS